MSIEGVKSDWMKPSPFDLGMSRDDYATPVSSKISDYKIKF